MMYKDYNLADSVIIDYEDVIKDKLALCVANYYLESRIEGGSISLPQLAASVECITDTFAVLTFNFDFESFYKLDFAKKSLEEIDNKDPISYDIIYEALPIKFITEGFKDYLASDLDLFDSYDVEYRPEFMRYRVKE